MIKLNEIIFSKKELKYCARKIVVNMSHVMYMSSSVISCSAPSRIDSLIYGDNIPDYRYKPLDETQCTTLFFDSGKELEVKETIEEIMQLMKED